MTQGENAKETDFPKPIRIKPNRMHAQAWSLIRRLCYPTTKCPSEGFDIWLVQDAVGKYTLHSHALQPYQLPEPKKQFILYLGNWIPKEEEIGGIFEYLVNRLDSYLEYMEALEVAESLDNRKSYESKFADPQAGAS